MSKELIARLNKIDKIYFSLKDIEKLWGGKRDSLKVVLSRMVKTRKLIRIQRNFYVLPNKMSEMEKVGNVIYFPSYLSFESALARWGILSQVPYTLTFATKLKTKKLNFHGMEIEYRHVQEKLFFGYELHNGIYIALPEKAILDTLYFVSLGKMSINLKQLDCSSLNWKRLLTWANKFPYKTKKIAHALYSTKKK